MKLYHHPASTTSRPVMLFAAEQRVPLELQVVDLFTGEHLQPPFEAINPNHLVPVLEDGDFRLTESSAILKYLADKIDSPLYPKDLQARARVNERMDWVNTQLCRDFVDWSTGTPNENNRQVGIKPRQSKVSDQTARRRLEDLRAAVNAYHAEHTLSVVPKITLPPKAEGRHRWLTRNEAARPLGAAIGYVWDSERNFWKRKEDGKLLRRERWITSYTAQCSDT